MFWKHNGKFNGRGIGGREIVRWGKLMSRGHVEFLVYVWIVETLVTRFTAFFHNPFRYQRRRGNLFLSSDVTLIVAEVEVAIDGESGGTKAIAAHLTRVSCALPLSVLLLELSCVLVVCCSSLSWTIVPCIPHVSS